ncbi:MAG: Rdx family protein [Planctomycetales bacterium]|nr:Rdx family protein [Planctomycetales bacterium]MCA9265763.1 Rdx family protein [Planctomycetales bacterium]
METFKQKISVLELEPSGGGCFELEIDGQAVYSKLQTGEFPDVDTLMSKIAELKR